MNADPIARLYRLLEYATFGNLLWRARTHFLSELQSSRRILILGEGDGRFLAALLAINPHATIDCYDTSAKMLTLARRRAARHCNRVAFHQQDILTAQLSPATYDAIIANFVFDCFNNSQLTRLISNLHTAAQHHCLWHVAEFAIPSRGPAHFAGALLTRLLYLAFALTTGLHTRRLPDYPQILKQSGLTQRLRKDRLFSLLTSQIWSR